MNREEKAALIDRIGAEITSSDAIFAIDYRGISVPQAKELRVRLRESDATFQVVKNRLTKLAAEKTGLTALDDVLQGPTALTFVKGDTAQAAKTIATFSKEYDVLTYKGGVMGEDLLSAESFTMIATLPTRDVLNAQLAGMVASPIVGLVRGLGSMISGLAIQLQQIAEQGLVGKGAPAEAEAATEEPKAEEPKAEEAPAEEAKTEEAPAEAEASEEAPAEAEAATEEPKSDEGSEDAGADGAAEGSEEAPADEATKE